MTDELEQRLRAANPVPPTVPVDRARSPRARTLVEHIVTDTHAALDTEPTPRARRWPLLAVAAAAVVAVVGVAVVVASDDDAPVTDDALSLTIAAEDPMAMCIELTPETLGDPGVELAFKGTVTSVDGDQATLRVDEWFRGGDAEEVTLTAPAEAETALLGAVTLEEGAAFLISAADGAVRSCGQSGPLSPELEALFTEAFDG